MLCSQTYIHSSVNFKLVLKISTGLPYNTGDKSKVCRYYLTKGLISR